MLEHTRICGELVEPACKHRKLAMSIEDKKDYISADATAKMQSLALEAGNATREEAIKADQTPVSRLSYTAACREVTAEYYRAHQISPTVLDDRQIENHYKPEVFALLNGPIWIKPEHTAVVIPLSKIGSPRIIVKNRNGKTYNVAWQTGSIHYLGEDISLDMEEGGKVVFLFLLFKMRQ